MPKGVYSAIDYQFRWGRRDLRPPSSWTAADRAGRYDVAIVSGRWSDSLNNPYGAGPALPGKINLVDVGCFFLTYNVNAPGAFVPGQNPPFPSQDGCPKWDYVTFPTGDDVEDWRAYCVANGMHDFTADLSGAGVQGWYAPGLRIDEVGTTITGGTLKLFQPLWAFNFRKAGAGQVFADYVLNNYGAFDGINFEYWEPPAWYKNWGNCSFWAGLSAGQKTTFLTEWQNGVLDAVSRLRAAGKIVIGQQVPSSTSSYDAALNGMFRENNPFQFISPRTNAACIANDQQHKASIAAADPSRPYLSGWHVWHPKWTPTLNYFDDRLGRATLNQTEHDSLIEHWKEIAAATAGAVMFIGDAQDGGDPYDQAWEGPPSSPRKSKIHVPNRRTSTLAAPRVVDGTVQVSRPTAGEVEIVRSVASEVEARRMPQAEIAVPLDPETSEE